MANPHRYFGSSGKQTAACLVASLPVFMTGICLGWPSPVLSYMSSGHSPVSLTPYEQSWMVSCIDIGTFAMSVPAGWLMDRMGRKFSVNLSAPLMLAGWLCILFSRRAWLLYVARLIQGAAVGIAWVVSPAYVGEMASVHIRGKLGLLVQLSYAGGLLFAYTAGWLLDDYTKLAVTMGCVSVVSGVLFRFLPESPYYLTLNGKTDDAARSLMALRCYANEEELLAELDVVKDSVLSDGRRGTIRDLFVRDRWPLFIVLTMAFLQMACGASVLEVYAATILSGAQISGNACAVVLGLIVVAASVPFALSVDRCGRRPLMVVSSFGTAACHAVLAVLLSGSAVSTAAGWASLFGAMAGVQFFINIGLMPMLSVVQCEYFASDTRALADTAVVLTVTFTATVMMNSYQVVADVFGVAANFAFYAVASLAGGVFCYAYMPETKCKSFADIQLDFQRKATPGNDNDAKIRNNEYEAI